MHFSGTFLTQHYAQLKPLPEGEGDLTDTLKFRLTSGRYHHGRFGSTIERALLPVQEQRFTVPPSIMGGVTKIKIGTPTLSNYSANRNFIDLPLADYEFKKVFSWYKIPSFISWKLFKKTWTKAEFLFNDSYLNNDIVLLHFFNSVSNGTKPWVVSFESYVPYWKATTASYSSDLKLLVRDACKSIIPISQYAKSLLQANVERYCPKNGDDVDKKITIIHPPQRKVLDSFSDKRASQQCLTVALVGSFFFNKGGLAVLRAVKRLHDQRYPIRLLVVSNMTYKVWNETNATSSDYEFAMRFFAENTDFVTYYNRIPNLVVTELLKNVNIGLLPSLGDTYGYSVLEFMSAGCPVITTDLFVFPEIVNASRGWIIPINKDSLNNPILTNQKQINQALSIIEEHVFSILKSASSNPEVVMELGRNAWEYVDARHNQYSNARILERIYDDSRR